MQQQRGGPSLLQLFVLGTDLGTPFRIILTKENCADYILGQHRNARVMSLMALDKVFR